MCPEGSLGSLGSALVAKRSGARASGMLGALTPQELILPGFQPAQAIPCDPSIIWDGIGA